MAAHRRSRYGLTYGACPRDDFRSQSVLPTQREIREDKDIFMRPSILYGGYRNKHHYLDVQFTLLKQDFVIPLRQGIRKFKKSGMAKHFNSSDLRMYHDVHILGIIATPGGIDHVLKFDTSKLKTVKWDFSKRLIFGSLVCLSKDGFETMAMATISDRDAKALRYGHVNVNFKSGLDIIFNSTPDDEYVMAETVTFYEAYCHVLEGLQEMSENLPFEEHIVYCRKDVNHPQYLLGGRSRLHYDLTTLMKDRWFFRIPDLIKTKWPSSNEMCLNKSQRKAAHLALTRRLAVIQGPPGTGKTFVGLKVVETILSNPIRGPFSCYGNNPILVVCYTNHALDQFLEGILEFCDGIIRVEGGSKSACLEYYNLKNLRRTKQRAINKSVRKSFTECRKELEYLGKIIQETSQQMEHIDLGICRYEPLLSVMDPRHQSSLLGGNRHVQTMLSRWLNLRNEDPGESVAKTIEDNMTKLILRGNFMSHHSTLSADMPVEARATLYLKLVSDLKSHFEHEIEKLRSYAPHRINRGKIDSYRLQLEVCEREIVSDKWIKLVLTKEQFYMIQTFIGNTGTPNSVIKTWLLGSHKGLHEQLNDTERLLATVYESNSRDQDDFVPEDVKRTAVDDEDDVDEEYFAKRNALRNSFSSIVLRLEKLKLQDVVDDDDADDDYVDDHYDESDYDDDQYDDSDYSDDHYDDSDYSDDYYAGYAVGRVTKSYGVWQRESKPLSFTEQRRKLRRTRAMTSRQARTIRDVWGIDMTERFALYKLWLERCKEQLASRMLSLVKQYERVLAEKKILMNQETVCILRNARVIGMTTTGAAKYRSVLQDVGCRIIVVEEAAEVLEAHTVTALNKHCEHLILIGDHQQLRPSPGVYELEKNFGLGVSLFERLVNNQFPFVMLQEQHRMRPEISKVMRHIYPDLKDHPVVSSYEHIRGVSKDVFFINHTELESSVEDTRSKSNNFEASYVTKLCSYLLFQGYDPSQITILATYTGQVLAIKNCMKECRVNIDVRITSVDNFQGEENDIIILSLVRSNEGKAIGFLKVDNRVCVALSRAKKGLFIIGNFELLSSQSALWRKILSTARSEGIVGDGLPVVCPNHPDQVDLMFNASDFDSRPLGGCGRPCNYKLKCGHLCVRKCHGFDQLHKHYLWSKSCTMRCKFFHPLQ